MFRCLVCGSTEFENDFVGEVFNVNGKHVLVEHIPAIVCRRCGDKTFTRETTEKIRKMIHGKEKPVKSVAIDVFDFA